MKEYRFQNTNQKYMLYLMLGCFATLFTIMYMGITVFHRSNFIFIISLLSAFIVFWIFKKKVVFDSIAVLNDESVSFRFESGATQLIEFKNLVSYKIFYSSKGPIVRLKLKNELIKLLVHNFYCDDQPFYLFCKDLEDKLQQYNGLHPIKIIDEGSVFIKKGMVYFLIIVTSIYVFSFFTEPKDLKVPISIGGGIFLFIMWFRHYTANQKGKL